MATEKKSDKDRSVEERLKSLYQLQECLSKIDRIHILQGELPEEVKDLEDEIVRYQTRIAKFEKELEEQKGIETRRRGEIGEYQAKIANYEEQINNVRNNREYSFLKKEEEYLQLEIEMAEKNIREAGERQQKIKGDIEHAQEELSDTEHNLEEKRRELEEIQSETAKEEEALLAEAKKYESQIDKYTLDAFKRIRGNAHNGLGIVTVQRNACGGCFNRIPPQRQLEIKMHKKVIVCEYCSRILIDGVLVGFEEKIEEPKPAKRTLKKSSEPKD